MQLARITGFVLLATAINGCDDADPVQPDQDLAAVVIANTAFGTSDVDVGIAGNANPIALGLDFGFATSQCVLVPAEEDIEFTFSVDGAVIASEDVALQDGRTYTILLTSNGTGRHAVVLADEVTVGTNQRAVRFENATADPGDVYLFTDGDAMGSVAVADLSYVGTAVNPPQYLLRAAGETEVRFFDPDVSTGEPRAERSIPSAAIAPVATVIFAQTATGTEVFMLGPCG